MFHKSASLKKVKISEKLILKKYLLTKPIYQIIVKQMFLPLIFATFQFFTNNLLKIVDLYLTSEN